MHQTFRGHFETAIELQLFCSRISLCLIELPELYAKNIVGVLDIDNVVEIQK
jgi:hypothetical protein